jgi:hypothetical protein
MDIRLKDGKWTHTPTHREEFYVYAKNLKIEVSNYKKQLKEQEQELKYRAFGLDEQKSIISRIFYNGIVPKVFIIKPGKRHQWVTFGFTPSTRWIPYDPTMKDAWACLIDREVARNRMTQLLELEQFVSTWVENR